MKIVANDVETDSDNSDSKLKMSEDGNIIGMNQLSSDSTRTNDLEITKNMTENSNVNIVKREKINKSEESNTQDDPSKTKQCAENNSDAKKVESQKERYRNRSKSDIAGVTTIIDGMQKIVINPEFGSHKGEGYAKESRRKSDLDNITDSFHKMEIAKGGSGGRLVSRGPQNGRSVSYSHDDYNRIAQYQQKPHQGGEVFGKRGRDSDGNQDYKFTRPEHITRAEQQEVSQLTQNSINLLVSSYMPTMPSEIWQQYYTSDQIQQMKQLNDLSINKNWQIERVNVGGSGSDASVTVPDVEGNLDELLKMFDNTEPEFQASDALYENKHDGQSHIRKISGDEGIDVTDVYSPMSIKNLASPDSGFGSPQGADSPISPPVKGNGYKQLRSPVQYLNSPQRAVSGSPHHISGSPGGVILSPTINDVSQPNCTGTTNGISSPETSGNIEQVICVSTTQMQMMNPSEWAMNNQQSVNNLPHIHKLVTHTDHSNFIQENILANNPYMPVFSQSQMRANIQPYTVNTQNGTPLPTMHIYGNTGMPVSTHKAAENVITAKASKKTDTLDSFFLNRKDLLDDINNTIVDDLIDDNIDSLKKLLETDTFIDAGSLSPTLSVNTNTTKLTEKSNVKEASPNQPDNSLYNVLEDFMQENCDNGNVNKGVSDFSTSSAFNLEYNQENSRLSDFPPDFGNKLSSRNNNPVYAPQVVMSPLAQQLQKPVTVMQKNGNNHGISQSVIKSKTHLQTNVPPGAISGQNTFIVQTQANTNSNVVRAISTTSGPQVQLSTNHIQINGNVASTLPQVTPVMMPATVISQPVAVSTNANQLILLPVQMLPNNKPMADAPKDKTKRPPSAPLRKLLPKSPPAAPTVPPVYVSGPMSANRSQGSVSKPMANNCLNVTSSSKLNIARRCVANMTLEDLQHKDQDGDTYLHVAVCRTDQHLVQAMLERIDKEGLLVLIDAQNSERQTPLYLAVVFNQPIMVRLFIKYGADVNTMTQAALPNGQLESKAAIHTASEGCNNYLNTLNELIQAKDINLNLATSGGLTALHCAILEHGNPKGDNLNNCNNVVQLLIRSGADPNVQDKITGRTPLMYAIQTLDYSLVETIIHSVDRHNVLKMIRAQTFDGQTCTRIASSLQVSDKQDMDNWRQITSFLLSANQNLANAQTWQH